jgi:hypothetical protein
MDHDGMELITGVLEAPDLLARCYPRSDPSMLEISQYLKALEEDRSALWFARTTKDCGLHVHIGVSSHGSVDQIPLNVMQHLAYILVQYEDIISCLHHPQRRGFVRTTAYIGTNKMGINGHKYVCNQYVSTLKPFHSMSIYPMPSSALTCVIILKAFRGYGDRRS